MEYIYKKCGLEDIDLLTVMRVLVLVAANRLPKETDMSQVEKHSREYYKKALADGSHTAYLVFDGDKVIGTGGISYYSVMPTFYNVSGRKAYVMNMYTDPAYRRQGVAIKTLDLLVKDSLSRGVEQIGLEATDMGRPLYERYGFEGADAEMELPEAIIERNRQ